MKGSVAAAYHRPILTCVGGNFNADNMHKPIAIEGAGTSGAVLHTTISEVLSKESVVLADEVHTTVINRNVWWNGEEIGNA